MYNSEFNKLFQRLIMEDGENLSGDVNIKNISVYLEKISEIINKCEHFKTYIPIDILKKALEILKSNELDEMEAYENMLKKTGDDSLISFGMEPSEAESLLKFIIIEFGPTYVLYLYHLLNYGGHQISQYIGTYTLGDLLPKQNLPEQNYENFIKYLVDYHVKDKVAVGDFEFLLTFLFANGKIPNSGDIQIGKQKCEVKEKGGQLSKMGDKFGNIKDVISTFITEIKNLKGLTDKQAGQIDEIIAKLMGTSINNKGVKGKKPKDSQIYKTGLGFNFIKSRIKTNGFTRLANDIHQEVDTFTLNDLITILKTSFKKLFPNAENDDFKWVNETIFQGDIENGGLEFNLENLYKGFFLFNFQYYQKSDGFKYFIVCEKNSSNILQSRILILNATKEDEIKKFINDNVLTWSSTPNFKGGWNSCFGVKIGKKNGGVDIPEDESDLNN